MVAGDGPELVYPHKSSNGICGYFILPKQVPTQDLTTKHNAKIPKQLSMYNSIVAEIVVNLYQRLTTYNCRVANVAAFCDDRVVNVENMATLAKRLS